MTAPTPHISARIGDFAPTVIMPGDPLRAKFIAENFLENATLVNNVRGVQGYTGTYKNVRLSVMASGMGIPSMAIYSYELFDIYGVENIIRAGTAGAVAPDVKLRDIVIGLGCCTNSSFSENLGVKGLAPVASFKLVSAAQKVCLNMGIKPHIGNLLTTDDFYAPISATEIWRGFGVKAVEMESAALYINALRTGKNAVSVCTISDCPFTGESLSSEERQNRFTQMMEIVLETAVLLK